MGDEDIADYIGRQCYAIWLVRLGICYILLQTHGRCVYYYRHMEDIEASIQ